MKILVLMNHQLTQEQRDDLIKNHNVEEFIEAPDDIKNLWSNINPEWNNEELLNQLKPIFDWIDENSNFDTYAIILGEFTAFYHVTNFWLEHLPTAGLLVPTTKREAIEEKKEDGSIVKKSVFKHVRFRHININ